MQNAKVTYQDDAVRAAREAEVPHADFHEAGNNSVGGVVGVCTAVAGFSDDNFSYETEDPVESQYIGYAPVDALARACVANLTEEGVDTGGDTAFIIAPQDTAPNDGFITGLLNKTGRTVFAGENAFGFRTG